ncbi:MAG: flagellar hook-associated protein FlgK [Oscillospiraceae bacterium]|nr:flagellar hook-associated protein FlgK [Oscillospiraceae bacterium]
MRPTFMGFEIAKSSIFENQKRIDIVGNNLANASTAGYTRQRVETAAISPSAYSTRISSQRVGLAGQGVEALGVGQVRDEFLDKRFRDEYTKASYHSQVSEILQDVQSALGDGKDISDTSGLFGAMANIYTSLNDYCSEPTLETQANIVLSAFKNITQVLQQMNSQLDNVAAQHTYDTSINVDRVNEILQRVAHINQMISQDFTVVSDPNNEHFRPNELMDERNLLLDELSSFADINVTQKSDGTVDVDLGGKQMVKGIEYNTLLMQKNDDGTIGIRWRETGEDVLFSSGALKASLDIINGRGANVQSKNESSAQGIRYYRDKIDSFANALMEVANSCLPEFDADGKPIPGKYKTLLGEKQPDGSVSAKNSATAANITISTEWQEGGAGYFICSRAEDMRYYAQQISHRLTGADTTFKAPGESFTGTFEEYYNDTLSKLGSDISFHEGRRDAVSLIADDFQDRRDDISGVSRDEETANMLMYQKAYEAAARVMTTLDDLLDVIVNRMGRVGL